MDTIDRENFLSLLAILQKKKIPFLNTVVLPPNQYTIQISTNIHMMRLKFPPLYIQENSLKNSSRVL